MRHGGRSAGVRSRIRASVCDKNVMASRAMVSWAVALTWLVLVPSVSGGGCEVPGGSERFVALYTYSFGNYRGELSDYHELGGGKHIRGWRDKYLFTDDLHNASAQSAHEWVVCEVPASRSYIPESAFPNYRPRVVSGGWELTKYFKFGHLPRVLLNYEYVMHQDMSTFSKPLNSYPARDYTLPPYDYVKRCRTGRRPPLRPPFDREVVRAWAGAFTFMRGWVVGISSGSRMSSSS